MSEIKSVNIQFHFNMCNTKGTINISAQVIHLQPMCVHRHVFISLYLSCDVLIISRNWVHEQPLMQFWDRGGHLCDNYTQKHLLKSHSKNLINNEVFIMTVIMADRQRFAQRQIALASVRSSEFIIYSKLTSLFFGSGENSSTDILLRYHYNSVVILHYKYSCIGYVDLILH